MCRIDHVKIVGPVLLILKIQNALSDCYADAGRHAFARKSRRLPRPDRKIHGIHEDDPRRAADRSATDCLTQLAPGVAIIMMPVEAGYEPDVLAGTARDPAGTPALAAAVMQWLVDYGVEKNGNLRHRRSTD